jgi:asparagine synthase (glutamine-hydrolysing)
MAYSTELREPFLDYRMVEFAFAQDTSFKIKDGQRKWMLRQLAGKYLPGSISSAPKRALQTPQREWLKGDMKDWMVSKVEKTIEMKSDWFDKKLLQSELENFTSGNSTNSFYIWQWMSLGL